MEFIVQLHLTFFYKNTNYNHDFFPISVTGEKPHLCKICHRGFSSSGHLNGHMRSHSGLKTHECNICRKKFAGSSSLKVCFMPNLIDKVKH